MTLDIKKSILYSTIASLAYAISGIAVKYLTSNTPYTMIVFSRFLVGLLYLTPFAIRNNEFALIRNYPIQFVRGGAGLLAIMCFFCSLKYIPIVDAIALNNVAPLFIPIILFLFYKVSISRKLIFCIIIGFIGVLLIIKPDKGIFNWMSLIALLSSFFAAIASLSIKRLSKTNSTQSILFFYFLISTVFSAFLLPVEYPHQTIGDILLMIMVGILALIFQYSVTRAFKYSNAEVVSPLLYMSVLFGLLFDWIFHDKAPSFYSSIGTIFIVLSCMFILVIRKRENNNQ
ncbi:DMT family transporter [Vibrio sp. S4M6]|uniref:DMT family transporter n=1 Tax=Vibrio sinus TaxID=2946865 RepID=UPI002029FC19|nr:DMT family transporter [Vibrio sinus]MCL9782143.1 DMT family transporter [Vibrio sinus]